GLHEIRAKTRLGFTSPRAFAVNTLPEVPHVATNNDPKTPMPLPLGTIVNAHTDADQIDHYKLELKRDQRVVIQCRGEPIDSRIDATLVLNDPKGREVGRDRDTLGRDAILDYTAPEDGAYIIHVFDFTHRGGAEFPYRLLASGAPHIDFIYPPAGQPGTKGRYKIYGRNLPGGSKGEGVRLGRHELESVEVEIQLAQQPSSALGTDPVQSALVPGIDYRMAANGLFSNPVRIGFAAAPIVVAIEGADDQTVSIPCEIDGRFDQRSDLDRFRFEGKKGAELWIECLAERLGSRCDPIVIIERITVDDKGNEQIKEVASNDDAGSGAGGRQFPLHTRDAFLRFPPDDDGLHRVTVLNQVGLGGPGTIYRLVMRPAAPDFELVATPWSATPIEKRVDRTTPILRRGGTAIFRVFAIRRNAFTDAVVLSAEGLPPGVTSRPVTIRKGKDAATFVFKAADDAPDWKGFIKLKGTAGSLVREARSGAISWSVSNHDNERSKARLSTRHALSVCADEKAALIVQPPEQAKYEVELNGKVELPVKLVKHFAVKGDVVISPAGLPYTKNAPQLKIKGGAGEGKLGITFKKTGEFPIEPGEWQFSLVASGTVKHRHNLAEIERAEQDRKRVEELQKKIQEEAKQARAAVDPAKKGVQEAENNLKSATPESKAGLEAALKEKQAQFKTAEDKAKGAEDKAKAAGEAMKAAAARAKQAGERAKEKELKHGTYSLPITVVVKPPPPKEEGK
ncbi:MAG: hypothetical protein HRU37_00005, partial [Roseibacillus sp.]|nr:hypothetical protein [Roseibacillus sp.]